MVSTEVRISSSLGENPMTSNQPNTYQPEEFPDGWIQTVSAPIASEVAKQIRSQMKANSSPYVSVPEAAEYLRCKTSRIYQLLSDRTLTRYRDGARVLILKEELAAHVQSADSRALMQRRVLSDN
jgi:excisionase family DNA binding protein